MISSRELVSAYWIRANFVCRLVIVGSTITGTIKQNQCCARYSGAHYKKPTHKIGANPVRRRWCYLSVPVIVGLSITETELLPGSLLRSRYSEAHYKGEDFSGPYTRATYCGDQLHYKGSALGSQVAIPSPL